MSAAKVKLHVRPPLSFEITKQTGGLTLEEEIHAGETLGELLLRLETQNPAVFQQVYDAGIGEIRPPVVTVVNGTTLPRSEAITKELANGDKITWFLMYAGG